MRVLTSKLDTKTTTIRDSKNLYEMTVQKLYENLLTYELELNQRAETTTITTTTTEANKKDKGVALRQLRSLPKPL